MLISSITITTYSTTNNDSLYQLNLRLFINDCEYCFKALESAEKQMLNDSLIINKQDSVIKLQDTEISNHSHINFNLEQSLFYARKEIAELKEQGLKWYYVVGGGGLILIIGILTGLLVK